MPLLCRRNCVAVQQLPPCLLIGRRRLHVLAISDRSLHPALELVKHHQPLPEVAQLQTLATTDGTVLTGKPLPWDDIGWGDISLETQVVCAAHWGPRTRECHLEILDRAPNLQWLHSLSAGVEHLPLAAFRERGVVVTHHNGVSDSALVEFAVLGLLHFVKQVPRLQAAQRDTLWLTFEQRSLRGARLAVLGWGSIGKAVGRTAKHGLGMHVTALTRRASAVPGDESDCDEATVIQREGKLCGSLLRQALSQADHVVLALPHTPATAGLIGAAELAAMQPGAVLINVGRGSCIDEAALATALDIHSGAGAAGCEGKRLFFASDVFTSEPLPANSSLWGRPNVLISPHSADWTCEVKLETAHRFVQNLELWVQSGGDHRRLKGVVNLELGY
jgi:phosphoglycerate dehydrogenase-like enzyme